jgi:hypothetical protein
MFKNIAIIFLFGSLNENVRIELSFVREKKKLYSIFSGTIASKTLEHLKVTLLSIQQ